MFAFVVRSVARSTPGEPCAAAGIVCGAAAPLGAASLRLAWLWMKISALAA